MHIHTSPTPKKVWYALRNRQNTLHMCYYKAPTFIWIFVTLQHINTDSWALPEHALYRYTTTLQPPQARMPAMQASIFLLSYHETVMILYKDLQDYLWLCFLLVLTLFCHVYCKAMKYEMWTSITSNTTEIKQSITTEAKTQMEDIHIHN